MGGPFADRSGGLITFQTESDAQAEQFVADDPFVSEGLLEQHWGEAVGTRLSSPVAAVPVRRPALTGGDRLLAAEINGRQGDV
jgi:hypothetical protein